MVKYRLDKYPMGSFPYQKSPGRYMHPTLYENLDILAKNITKDLTYMGIIFSSTYEVGAGKSTVGQQIGEAYLELVKHHHGIEDNFEAKNLIFTPMELKERAFQVPKCSFILVDEWEDAHYWSKLGIALRDFFRKCRQLNLFIILIIPNFFQLPIQYAISRSLFAIDVRFFGEFERGELKFYNFEAKKDLYLKGKKTQNYNVVPNSTSGVFLGDFVDGYVIPKNEYLQLKKEAFAKIEEQKKPEATEHQIQVRIFSQLRRRMPQITMTQWEIGWLKSSSTLELWQKEGAYVPQAPQPDDYIKNKNRKTKVEEEETNENRD